MGNERRGVARAACRALVVAGLLASGAACGLDEVVIPPLDGPSTLGTGVRVSVTPDVLMADGQSTSVVVVSVIDANGQPLAGRELFLLTGDDFGRPSTLGKLSSYRGTTDARGQLRVVFTAPAREEFQANASLTVLARLAGTDAEGSMWAWSSARIELIAVDQRRWPPTSATGPKCGFVLEPRWGSWYVGVPIRFQSRAYDLSEGGYIIEYLWKFGDNATAQVPDLYHTYGGAGSFWVFHSVVDNDGWVDSCNLEIDVVDAP